MYDNCILKLNVHKLSNKLTSVSGNHTSFNILSETLDFFALEFFLRTIHNKRMPILLIVMQTTDNLHTYIQVPLVPSRISAHWVVPCNFDCHRNINHFHF